MNGRVRIRPAEVLDVPVLAVLHALIFPDEPWDVPVWVTQMALAETRILLAEDPFPTDDAVPLPLGILAGRQILDEAEILTIGTQPSAQRRGVATALLNHYQAGLAKDGVTALFLEVAEDNPAARKFYARHHFWEVGQRRNYYQRPGGVGVTARVLRYDIVESAQFQTST